MSLLSKWESKIIVPSGGWSIEATHSVEGAQTVTFTAAEEYYWSSTGTEANDLAAEFQSKLNAAFTAAFTVTVAAGDGGAGTLTVAVDSGTVEFTGTFTASADAVMGALQGEGPAASVTSTKHVKHLWLPDCPVDTPYGLASSGIPVSSAAVSLSEDGTYTAVHGAKFVRNEYVYQATSLARVVQASEATANESYEQFWLDCIRGEVSTAQAGRELRFYRDTDDDATVKTYNVLNAVTPDVQRAAADYDGFWRVRLEVAEN